MDPMPIGRTKTDVYAKRHGAREQHINFEFSRGHDENRKPELNLRV